MRNLIYSLTMSLDGFHRHFNERERSTAIAPGVRLGMTMLRYEGDNALQD